MRQIKTLVYQTGRLSTEDLKKVRTIVVAVCKRSSCSIGCQKIGDIECQQAMIRYKNVLLLLGR